MPDVRAHELCRLREICKFLSLEGPQWMGALCAVDSKGIRDFFLESTCAGNSFLLFFISASNCAQCNMHPALCRAWLLREYVLFQPHLHSFI